MDKTGNPVRAAIAAAGGYQKVADLFGVSARVVATWWTRLGIPPECIDRLCEAGGGIVDPDVMREYVAERLAERAATRIRQRFAVAAALGRNPGD